MYRTHTNPFSPDTDGDGAPDPSDRDPLYNLVVKITVLEGHDAKAWITPLLAVVVKVEDQAITTQHQWGSKDGGGVKKTASFNYAYYFDISDQDTVTEIRVELWWISWLWDNKLLDMSYAYSVGNGTDSRPSPVVQLKNSAGYWVTFRVETVGMKRVNTLAIYSEGSFFQGHYPALERFTLLILGVKDAGSPFTAGVNVILVPVSIFLRTELHAKLASGDTSARPPELGEGSASTMEAAFYGIDPDAETVSEYIEGLIIKGLAEGDYVTIPEALAILNYVLKNETGVLTYSYFSCDEVGEVECLGLATDILAQIYFDAQAMGNGPTGATPKGFVDWLISAFIIICTFGIVLPFLFLVALVEALIIIGITWLGPLFEAIVLAIIKVIILVYVFIMLAIALLLTLIGFLILIIFLFTLTLIVDYPLTLVIGPLWFELTYPEATTRLEITIEFKYSSFIDLRIPCLKTAYSYNLKKCEYLFSFGIPIDPEAPRSYTETKASIYTEIATNNFQLHSQNSEIDDTSYNLGRMIAFTMGAFSMAAITFLSYPIYGYVLIGTTLAMILFGAFSIMAGRALTKGFGLGLVHIGLLYWAPLSPGTFFDIPAGMAMSLVYKILKDGDPILGFPGFAPEFTSDSTIDDLYGKGLGIISPILFNYVQRDKNRSVTWLLMGFVFIAVGLILAAA